MAENIKVSLGFKALDFSTAFDAATTGSLQFVIKDHPTNADKHAQLLGLLAKSTLQLSVENNIFTVSIKENGNEKSN